MRRNWFCFREGCTILKQILTFLWEASRAGQEHAVVYPSVWSVARLYHTEPNKLFIPTPTLVPDQVHIVTHRSPYASVWGTTHTHTQHYATTGSSSDILIIYYLSGKLGIVSCPNGCTCRQTIYNVALEIWWYSPLSLRSHITGLRNDRYGHLVWENMLCLEKHRSLLLCSHIFSTWWHIPNGLDITYILYTLTWCNWGEDYPLLTWEVWL